MAILRSEVEMFHVGDKVVYPMHGAGVIDGIEEKEIFGKRQTYYLMHLPVGELSVMIPTETTGVALREISSADEAERVLEELSQVELCEDGNWNKRYRDNMSRLKNGALEDVAAVVKSLLERDRERSLSTSERKMLVSARQILVSEIVLATGESREQVETKIEESIA